MIKILAGKYKGRKLSNFKINSIRPTQARVKKSIMDKVMLFENKIVLDLFSGVGTLGIESISRGAKFVCFIEKNGSVGKILNKNLNQLCVDDNYKVEITDAIRFLKKTKSKFDIIFADPPYYKYDLNEIFNLVDPRLKKGGIFCYESEYQNTNNEYGIDIRKYGNTQVGFWRKK